MSKASPIQVNFNGGEISPLMIGRVDVDNYKTSLAASLNGIGTVQGPWTRRPATYFAAEVKDSTKATRMVRFVFSTTQAYTIEFGDLYMRFYRDGGPVLLTSQVISGITQANPAVVTYVGADTYANGDDVEIAGVVGMTQVNGRRFRVAGLNAGANTFQLTDMAGNNVDSSAFTAYSSGGTVAEVYTVTTTYAVADLFQLKFTQSADTLYVAHPSYPPRKITRTAHAAWSINTIAVLDGPYINTNTTATTLTLGGVGGTVSVTASAVTGINSDLGFKVTDIGRSIRWKDPAGNWVWMVITGWTSTTVVDALLKAVPSATTATVNWRLGTWSATDGYPGTVAFHQDRLCWAGATLTPQRIDMSKTADYETMSPTDAAGTVAANNAVSVTVNSNDVQVIRWMLSDQKGLLVGTVAGEWLIAASTQSEALSPTNVAANPASSYGSANLQGFRAGKAALYVQRAGRKLRELAYVFSADSFASPDMTVLAQHITLGGIIETAYQQEPQSIVWAVRSDGVLLSFVYERDQKVIGWHRHVLGGYSNAGHTADALVESVACIPAPDGKRDEVWMVVKRYINGRTVRYVEYLTKMWERGDAQEDGRYVDCCLTYDSTPTTTGTGAMHLAGETVSVLADGATHPNITISVLGGWTLTRSASVVHLGYAYNSDGQALRPEAGAADGTAQGKTQRSHRVVFRLLDSLGIQVGANFNSSGIGKLTRLPFRKSGDDTATAVPLFTGDVPAEWEGDYTSENYVCWRFDQPLPGTVVAIMPQLHTQDDGKAGR